MVIMIEEQAKVYIRRKQEWPAISIRLEERPRGI